MKVVATSGYYDPIHIGHIECLEKAKALGDKLVVIVNNDEQAKMKKGTSFMSQEDRLRIVMSLKCVDDAIIAVDKDGRVCETIKLIKPNIFAKGGDRLAGEIAEQEVCDSIGCEVVCGLGDKIRSSSELINKNQRKYMPTIAQLIDRLSIVNLKSIKVPEHKEAYEKEAHEIMNDLDLLLGKDKGQFVRAIQVNTLANETIWNNEADARAGGTEQDKLLKFTHTVNGVRNMAMNVISSLTGERKELKLDCLAAEICKDRGYDFGGIFNG